MAPHSGTLAWKIRGWRSPVGCSPWGGEELDMNERLHFHFYALKKEMATHSSVLAWRIPGMGSYSVGHDWSDLAVAATRNFGPKFEQTLEDSEGQRAWRATAHEGRRVRHNLVTEQQTTNQEFGRGESVPLWSIHYHVLPLSQKDTNREISPLFLKVYSSRVTLIPIDSKPDFIIKFEQEMLQGKSIMQMPE